MKPIQKIKIEDIHENFSSHIFVRGEEYFEEGLVDNLEVIDQNSISGVVRGNYDYDVCVTIDEDENLICDCSCPCDFNCKHAVALLLELIKNRKNIETKNSKKIDIDNILNEKSKNELIRIITDIVKKDKSFLNLIYINKGNIKKQVRNIFSYSSDWVRIPDLIKQLKKILDGFLKNLNQVDKVIIQEMFECADIMINNYELLHDDGDLAIFIGEWFKAIGNGFATLNPTEKENIKFFEKIMDYIEKDDGLMDGSFEEAFIGFCKDKNDIFLIKNFLISKDFFDGDSDSLDSFVLELYENIGLNDEYLALAKEMKAEDLIIYKYMELNQFEKALELCNHLLIKEKNSTELKQKKVRILKQLGRNDEYKETLFELCLFNGYLSDIKKLKKECNKSEWSNYYKKIIKDANNKKRNSLLMKLYYEEKDYKKSYKYSKHFNDSEFLELLAKKLSKNVPDLACNLFERLCYFWIESGTGYCYKKAGKLLNEIKKLNNTKYLYVKENIIQKYNKRYSLMKIIK